MNDADIYCLIKEEVDYDPSKIETLEVHLNMNDIKNKKGKENWIIFGSMPWIIEDVDEKVESALGPSQLSSLHILSLDCD